MATAFNSPQKKLKSPELSTLILNTTHSWDPSYHADIASSSHLRFVDQQQRFSYSAQGSPDCFQLKLFDNNGRRGSSSSSFLPGDIPFSSFKSSSPLPEDHQQQIDRPSL